MRSNDIFPAHVQCYFPETDIWIFYIIDKQAYIILYVANHLSIWKYLEALFWIISKNYEFLLWDPSC